MPEANILEAMDHPQIFAPHFKGDTWGFWRMVLAALFALPMDDKTLALYRQHTGRTAPPEAPFTEMALVIGRRGGKSQILALIAVYLACFRDYEPYLSPGEVATIAIIAADRNQARTIFRYVKGLLSSVPVLAPMVEDETKETLTLNNRVQIEIATASFRVTRGYTFAAVLADETAFWRDESSANPDTEIFRALRPGLATIPNSLLLNASSPYRRAGILWKAYQRNYGKDGARVLVVKASTSEANPKINPAIIAEAYEEDPESAACEYGGEFRTDIADFISRSVLEACIETGCHERPRVAAAGRYVAFIDAAGGSGTDSMTMAIAHEDKTLGPVLDVLRERKPPFSPESVVMEFAATLKSYGIYKAESDKWGGDWVGEAFRKQGITVTPSAAPKSEIYRELLPLLNAHKCSLLDHPRLVQQLCGLERRTARGGRDSIDHAPNAHDDVANAAAGALVLVSKAPAMMVFTKAFLDRI
ncbi:hypothetical protein [Acidocella aminolytica]|uniref:Phage terminase large subunit n=1 Tax=Acidocella aminolytica 101 = DSM 11237 TaxID=1120923 RepID=A0A0D6PL30_9PROT|nr:hypothetical protein [Acidocella aminolytica]GAN81469.1 hypothetical protein Aam_096_028 [Acidocella aminolytica 101 = DSM 11237]GBQ35021.1 hypothetical protein AA11237_0880 [Acidocella aminolytica 101 = DSM 11237]SHF02303.1 hypothetical protein SAMN02746095_01881 [Acidocella aminolytica 101 = DSM 11237]